MNTLRGNIKVGLLYLLVCGFIVWRIVWPDNFNFPAPGTGPAQVTLRAAPGNAIVQMFEKVGVGDEGNVSQFPDGTACTKHSGPTPVDFGDGTVLYFHKLTCHGVTGYVNVKWVD